MLIKELYEKIHKNISLRISGKDNVIDRVLIAVIAGGHVLLDDVPGTGKTTLAKALASSVDGTYSRVQFTPDLLPTDITGVNVYDMKKQEFSFRKGAVFTNILLADEINRAAPRTQSALLEWMEEKQGTADGVTGVCRALHCIKRHGGVCCPLHAGIWTGGHVSSDRDLSA